MCTGQGATLHKQSQMEPLATSTRQTNKRTENAELEQAKKRREDKMTEINKMTSTISTCMPSSGNGKRIIEKAK